MLEVKSYAKVNLALEVTGKREDGYHNISTLMCIANNYYDLITINQSEKFEVSTSGPYAFTGTNILQKTADLFFNYFAKPANFKISIIKNIKTGGGLGGGSSNAGFFLRFLLNYYNISLTQQEFASLALKIGADVPFFYNNRPKICQGVGEVIKPINFKMPQNLLATLIIPHFSVETKTAFANLKSFGESAEFASFDEVLASQNTFTAGLIDLKPEFGEILTKLKQFAGVIKADVSGSGSTCFALTLNQNDALDIAKSFKNKYSTVVTSLQTSN